MRVLLECARTMAGPLLQVLAAPAPAEKSSPEMEPMPAAASAAHAPDARSAKVAPGTWWIFVAIAVGTFMSALDGSVVNVVWPVMAKQMHASVSTIEWVVIIYLLVVSGTLLIFGRIGDLRGYKVTYVSGFVLFVVGSALCGLAPNEYVLVACRGFQALGAAMLFAAAPAILTTNFPPQRRGQVLGLQGTFTYLGLTVGPPLGAVLADKFGWPAVFYINVPIGLVAIFLSWRFIPKDAGAGDGEHFDFPGAATFLVGLVALVLALNNGSEWGWTSAPVLGLLAVAVAMLAAFIAIERRRTSPLMDLTLFGNRTFSVSSVTALLNYVGVYTVVFLMPSYLEQGRGLSLPQTGLLLMTMPLVMAVMAPISGTLSDRIGTRTPVIAGMAILAGGLFALGMLGPAAPLPLVGLVLAVLGFGVGVFVSPNTSALMGAAPPHRRGIASGILAEARNVGMVLGVALAGAVFTTVLRGVAPGANDVTFKALSAGFFVASGLAAIGAVVAATVGRSGAGTVERSRAASAASRS